MSVFRVGQKVCCVREHAPEIRAEVAQYGMVLPVKGEVYTVRAIIYYINDETPYVVLKEIINPVWLYQDGNFTEQGFDCDRFRPVVNRKTDISCFKALLTPSKETVSL